MNKLNPYYLYLQKNLKLLDKCFEGLEPQEESNEKIKICLIFMTLDRIASSISIRGVDYYSENVMEACIALTYTDIYLLSAWILEDLKRSKS